MIPLPADNATVLREAILPALELLPEKMRTPRAQVLLLAIGRHESAFSMRLQQPNGPAKGLWQFERGGVVGVITHPATRDLVPQLCAASGVPCTASAIYDKLETDDILAAGIARLNLWWMPGALPVLGDAEAAWTYYLGAWNPGRRDVRTRFNGAYTLALEALP